MNAEAVWRKYKKKSLPHGHYHQLPFTILWTSAFVCESFRCLELWFHKMEHWHQTIKRFAMREHRSFFFCSLIQLSDAANAFKWKHDLGYPCLPVPPFSFVLSFFIRLLRTCAPIFRFPLGKYVPNVLIEWYKKPENYFGTKCQRGEAECAGVVDKRELSITASPASIRFVQC